MKKIAAAAVMAVIVGSIGFSAQAENKVQGNSGGVQPQSPTVYLEVDDDIRADVWKQVKISTEEAKKRALAAQPGTIREIELEWEHGLLLYKVEIKTLAKKVDIYVDATTGETWRENDPLHMKKVVKISLDEAKKIALNKVLGTIVKAKLDEDDGQYIYEVEMRTNKWAEVEMDISATTGAILDVDWDD
ncbi:PepSY domain-containing protein [Brevibacillus centrosporus]|uniref:PepSY domain-containing protein n=1 Tax=Brevibacillus centrosporus TaxID=54910 RepID=UPI002E1F4A44|nr:PepSY domain-containing protein [Brevibacillus centrosporus]